MTSGLNGLSGAEDIRRPQNEACYLPSFILRETAALTTFAIT